jgi:hypothetical protein
MTEFIASGRAIDLVLALMAMEAIALYAFARCTGRGLAGPDLLVNLAAGVSLMLAVRAALTGAGPGWIAACLLASLLAHCVDLSRRWRRRGVPPATSPGRDGGSPAIALERMHK